MLEYTVAGLTDVLNDVGSNVGTVVIIYWCLT